MKQLKPTNLIAIEVPETDKFDIDIAGYTNLYNLTKGESDIILSHKEENYKILGEVTKEGIQFDVEPYLLKYGKTTEDNNELYNNYLYTSSVWSFKKFLKTPQESFNSLLQANNVGIPKGKKLLILLKK